MGDIEVIELAAASWWIGYTLAVHGIVDINFASI